MLLGGDRPWVVERGGRCHRGCVARGRCPLVPRTWRDGTKLCSCPLSGRYLSFAEREELALLRARGCGVRAIARQFGPVPVDDLAAAAPQRGHPRGRLAYRATTAQWHADRRARRPETAKLAANEALRTYVQDRLAGVLATPDGIPAPGPDVRWIGRRHGRRKDRRWAAAWSPEQIANRLPVDFPEDTSMRVSHEAIYQALYVQGRGALRRELTACLRTGRGLRVPRARARSRGKQFVTPEVMISQRPAEAEDRAVPGHWEGDLILGLDSSAIGTLVERTTRFTMLLHLPRMDGHGGPRVHNGPALAGHGAEAVRDAIAATMTALPAQLRQSLTWDQGAELAQHAQLRIATGLDVYFCDPHSPWQRLQREHQRPAAPVLPQRHRPERAQHRRPRRRRRALNSRPRKTSAGEHQLKPSTITYYHFNKQVLRRPLGPRGGALLRCGGPVGLPAAHARKPELAHELLHRAAGHRDPLPVQLPPNLAGAVDRKVVVIDPTDLDLELGVAHGPGRGRSAAGGVVGGRGDRQHPADRLDPEPVLLRSVSEDTPNLCAIEQIAAHCEGCSSLCSNTSRTARSRSS
jgi:IS30 family transposase